jgi:6-pyruvoyltetrahydropterin/6-carboxytetrahydropterin synthase
MYRVEKEFTLPIGHRLSKHAGRCSSIHGHNLKILIGVKSDDLNDNDMVIDFVDLKKLVNSILDKWDHTLLVNRTDEKVIDLCKIQNMRILDFSFDPTAEKLTQTLFQVIKNQLPIGVFMDYVTIFENEKSKATYSVS